jgi:hypothetical protein
MTAGDADDLIAASRAVRKYDRLFPVSVGFTDAHRTNVEAAFSLRPLVREFRSLRMVSASLTSSPDEDLSNIRTLAGPIRDTLQGINQHGEFASRMLRSRAAHPPNGSC